MKKVYMVSLIFLVLISLLNSIQVCFATPGIIENEQNSTKIVQQIFDYIDKQNYTDAMNLLEQVNIEDNNILNFNKTKFDKLLKEYKKILITTATTYTNNGEYVFALNLLNSKQKYYQFDQTITKLIQHNQKQIEAANQVEYLGNIEHLAVSSLIAYPEIAFSKKNTYASLNDTDHILATEFEKILYQLYNNNYVLVNINECYNFNNNTLTQNIIKLPSNKIPLVLHFDSHLNNGAGFLDKLIIDQNNQIATYTSKKRISERVSTSNGFVPILEQFVLKYPTFSHNGAKAVINLNSQNGLLGYKTQKKFANSKFEIKKVSKIVSMLKNNGWVFGCSFNDVNNTELELIQNLSEYKSELEKIVGPSHVFVSSEEPDKINFETLNSNNYYIICNDYPLTETTTNLITRKKINGKTLRNNEFNHLFSSNLVYDHTKRPIPFVS